MDNLTELGAITAVILSNSFVPTLQKLTPFFLKIVIMQSYKTTDGTNTIPRHSVNCEFIHSRSYLQVFSSLSNIIATSLSATCY